MEDGVTVEARYEGYVVLQTGSPDMKPGIHHARQAYRKAVAAKAKRSHDLPDAYLDGFDTEMLLLATPHALRAELTEGVGNLLVCNILPHKLAFIGSMEDDLVVIVKQDVPGKYLCLTFHLNSIAHAEQFASIMIEHTNNCFQRLREAAKDVLKTSDEQTPALPARTVDMTEDEDQPWYHGDITRERAEKLLSRNLLGGLFLVRQRTGSSTDYVLSFTWRGKIYHNLITRRRDGRLMNINQTDFASLTQMIQAYQSPHQDMQTVLTEYVPCGDEDANVADDDIEEAPEYMNLSRLMHRTSMFEAQQHQHHQIAQKEERTAPLESKLMRRLSRRLSKFTLNIAPKVAVDVQFDSMFDDKIKGFGDEFVKQALGLSQFEFPPAVNDVQGEVFNCGKIESS